MDAGLNAFYLPQTKLLTVLVITYVMCQSQFLLTLDSLLRQSFYQDRLTEFTSTLKLINSLMHLIAIS